MASRKTLLLALLVGTSPFPLLAQEAPPPQPEAAAAPAPEAPAAPAAPEEPALDPDDPDADFDEEEGETIVVTGQRQRGAVIGDIAPEVQFDRREIRALGAGTLSELLEAVSPQTRSGRGRDEGGRPIVLLNGRRISGFSEIRDIPPEAIERVDVMPEEVALKYGYRADQKVVNFVLRRRFRAFTGEVQGGLATAGGRESFGASGNYLQLDRTGRMQVAAEYRHANPLFESERDIIQADPVPGIELGRFRTLLPETDQLSLNGTLNRSVLGDVSATLNGSFDVNSSTAFLGLPRPSLTPPGLRRESDSRAGHLGLSLNGAISPWQWSLTAALDRNASESETQTNAGTDRSRSVSQAGSAELVMNGPLFDLPGGAVTAAARAGFDARGLDSEAERGGLITIRELARTREHAQVNVDVPIASRRRAVLTGLGNLSANFNAEVEHLSDFGTLRTLGAGLNWSPVAALSLIASVTDEDGAPSMQQLGDPVVQTPGVRVFDFVRGETVEVTRIDGGNPALIADNRRVYKLGATLRPISDQDLTLTANYTSSRLRNPISAFPAATAEIEAAFPERFQRDSSGRLLLVDARPVNFARADRSELRWGVNFSTPIGPQPQPPPGGWRRFRQGAGEAGATPAAGGTPGEARRPRGDPAQPSAEPARPGTTGTAEGGRGERRGGFGGGRGGFGGGRGGFGGGRGGFGGGGRGARLQLGLYHTWHFTDQVLIRPGVPELDFLDGSAASSRGGRPRHELEFQGGFFKNGMGARLTANWQSATTVRGGTAAVPEDLRFSDLATVNLRLFADLGLQPFAREHPFLRGMRVSLSVDNLFDSRQRVRDPSGTTPLSYQPGYLDPLGRSVRLSVRKLFF